MWHSVDQACNMDTADVHCSRERTWFVFVCHCSEGLVSGAATLGWFIVTSIAAAAATSRSLGAVDRSDSVLPSWSSWPLSGLLLACMGVLAGVAAPSSDGCGCEGFLELWVRLTGVAAPLEGPGTLHKAGCHSIHHLRSA